MGEEFSLEDVLIILQRRFLYFLIPVLCIAPLAVIAVMLLPAKYTATGTILVESQQIPTELVRSTTNTYAQERIEVIRQQVMTRDRLLEVADKYSLFPNTQGLSETDRTNIMRDKFDIDLITTRSNRGPRRDGTIAFTISYTDESPDHAYLVANEFVTLFQSEDIKRQLLGASNTTEFFEREATRLRNAVAELEERIAEYKSQNGNALPEHLSMHLDMLERATRELSDTEASMGALEEELRFLESQLLAGGGDSTLEAELARLQSELARLRGIYHDKHPSIQALISEIAGLRRQMAPSPTIVRLRSALTRAEQGLEAAKSAEPADLEAITAAEQNVIDVREELSDALTAEARRGSSDPQSAQLEGRMAVINNRLRSLADQREKLRTDIVSLQDRVAKTPEVERGLSALSRDHENLFREYQEVLAKQQDAQLAENLVEGQQAEKFTVLEPPARPEYPSSPDRPRLILVGLLGAFGIGGAIGLGIELISATIRGRNHLTNIIGGHPIAVIPYIQTENERRISFSLPFFGNRNRFARPAPEAS